MSAYYIVDRRTLPPEAKKYDIEVAVTGLGAKIVPCDATTDLDALFNQLIARRVVVSTLVIACHGSPGNLELGRSGVNIGNVRSFGRLCKKVLYMPSSTIIVSACNVARPFSFYENSNNNQNEFCKLLSESAHARLIASPYVQTVDTIMHHHKKIVMLSEGEIDGQVLEFKPTGEVRSLGAYLHIISIFEKMGI